VRVFGLRLQHPGFSIKDRKKCLQYGNYVTVYASRHNFFKIMYFKRALVHHLASNTAGKDGLRCKTVRRKHNLDESN
jgi:hypothetical protein